MILCLDSTCEHCKAKQQGLMVSPMIVLKIIALLKEASIIRDAGKSRDRLRGA